MKKIHVLQEYIDICRKSNYDETSCPISLALIDGGFPEPKVNSHVIQCLRILEDGEVVKKLSQTPSKRVKAFINKFDNGRKVKPFTFMLKD